MQAHGQGFLSSDRLNEWMSQILKARRGESFSIPGIEVYGPPAPDLADPATLGIDPSDREQMKWYARFRRHSSEAEAARSAGREQKAQRHERDADAAVEQLGKLGASVDLLREVLERQREEAKRGQGGGGGGGDGPASPQPKPPEDKPSDEAPKWLRELTDYFGGRGLGGLGELGNLLGRFGKYLGPGVLGAAAGAGLVSWMATRADANADGARNEALAFRDLSRATGNERGTWQAFLGGADDDPATNALQTRSEITALGLTAPQAGLFAARYGIPQDATGLAADAIAGLRLAKYLGADEGQIANLLSGGVRAGAGQAGQIEALSRVIFAAVREGTKEGVASSETFSVMQRFFEGSASQGVTTGLQSTALLAAYLENLNQSGSRALKGQAGAAALQNIAQGLAAPGSEGLDIVVLQSLMGDGGLTPEALGLSGEEAKTFAQLSPLMRARVAQEKIKALNPAVMRRVGAGIEAMRLPPDLQLMLGEQFLGLSRQQSLEITAQFGGIGEFLQSATPQQLQKFMQARPQDTKPLGPEGDFADDLLRKQVLEEERRRLTAIRDANSQLVGLTEEFRKLRLEIDKLLSSGSLGYFSGFGPGGSAYRPPLFQPQLPQPGATGAPGIRVNPGLPLPAPDPEHALVSRVPVVGGLGAQLGGTYITARPGEPYADPALAARYDRDGDGHEGLDYRIGRQGDSSEVYNYFGARLTVKDIRAYSDAQGKHNVDLLLRAPNGATFWLRHLRADPNQYRLNQQVEAGAYMGREGFVGSGFHIHVEPVALPGGGRVDPAKEDQVQRWVQELGFKGFNAGGFTGEGHPLDPAGIVHKGEFVVNEAVTRRHRPLLEALNSGADPSLGSGGGSGRLEVVFTGQGRVEVGGGHPAAPRLEELLSGALRQFATEIVNPYNEGNRRK